MLVVFETHPVQYHAPVYRVLERQHGIPVTVIYGSDASIAGYRDREFGTTFAWDTDLLSGYQSIFLSRIGHHASTSREQPGLRAMREALAAAAPSAVLLTGYSPRFHQRAFFVTWRAHLPVLFRGETTDHARARSPMKAWARDRALRALYARCAALLYVGERSYQHLSRLAPAQARRVFSPYCVDATTFRCDAAVRAELRPAVRRELGVGEAELVLLFSGKLVARKGPELLLHAAASLPAETRDRVALLFVGEGELRPDLQALARRLGLLRVSFAGFKNQTELSRYYHAADLLVLPSLHSETWGLVVNEALHHGVPVVVSDAVGCAPDLVEIGVTGEICEAGSVPALTAALLRAGRLVGRSEVGALCRSRVAGYSVERAAAGIAEAYKAAAGTRLRAPVVA